jgi:hypothetical protein
MNDFGRERERGRDINEMAKSFDFGESEIFIQWDGDGVTAFKESQRVTDVEIEHLRDCETSSRPHKGKKCRTFRKMTHMSGGNWGPFPSAKSNTFLRSARNLGCDKSDANGTILPSEIKSGISRNMEPFHNERPSQNTSPRKRERERERMRERE